jgi:hypothetical protein
MISFAALCCQDTLKPPSGLNPYQILAPSFPDPLLRTPQLKTEMASETYFRGSRRNLLPSVYFEAHLLMIAHATITSQQTSHTPGPLPDQVQRWIITRECRSSFAARKV